MELMKTANSGTWKPGQSGNPNGRPVGARQAFSAAFQRDLAEVWAMHGKQTMFHTARSSPETFFAVCSRLIPKEVALTVEQHYSAIDADDLAILKAIKAAISDAGDREPAEIFELTLNALKAYLAKPVIEGETT